MFILCKIYFTFRSFHFHLGLNVTPTAYGLIMVTQIVYFSVIWNWIYKTLYQFEQCLPHHRASKHQSQDFWCEVAWFIISLSSSMDTGLECIKCTNFRLCILFSCDNRLFIWLTFMISFQISTITIVSIKIRTTDETYK